MGFNGHLSLNYLIAFMYASTQFIFYIPSSRENMAKFGFIQAQELVCSEPISRKKILILH